MCLTDYGICREGLQPSDSTVATFAGIPEYLAPEIILGHFYDKAVDWWSFGIVLYEMFVNLPPFYSQDLEKMYYCITKDAPKFPDQIPPDARDLITKLLAKEPSERLADPLVIKAHPFFCTTDWSAFDTPSDPDPTSTTTTAHSNPTRSSPTTPAKCTLDDFQLLSVVGKGTFGKVLQVRREGQIYAMKVLSKSAIASRNEIEHTRAEKSVLTTVPDLKVSAAVTPPFVPPRRDATDVSNIDSCFTTESPETFTEVTTSQTTTKPKNEKQPDTRDKPEPDPKPEDETCLTSLPLEVEKILDEEGYDAVRPTIITPESQDKKPAFDLLDALSRSGSLDIESSVLHVVVAVTQAFDKSLLNCVIQNNSDPVAEVTKTYTAVRKVLDARK